eukprot:gene2013-3016_t
MCQVSAVNFDEINSIISVKSEQQYDAAFHVQANETPILCKTILKAHQYSSGSSVDCKPFEMSKMTRTKNLQLKRPHDYSLHVQSLTNLEAVKRHIDADGEKRLQQDAIDKLNSTNTDLENSIGNILAQEGANLSHLEQHERELLSGMQETTFEAVFQIYRLGIFQIKEIIDIEEGKRQSDHAAMLAMASNLEMKTKRLKRAEQQRELAKTDRETLEEEIESTKKNLRADEDTIQKLMADEQVESLSGQNTELQGKEKNSTYLGKELMMKMEVMKSSQALETSRLESTVSGLRNERQHLQDCVAALEQDKGKLEETVSKLKAKLEYMMSASNEHREIIRALNERIEGNA